MEYKNKDTGFFESAKGRNGAMDVRTAASDIIQPVDIQAHYQQTIQTHTNVMVGPNATNVSTAWVDVSGFDEIYPTLKNDAATSSRLDFQWSHDGVNLHAEDKLLITVGSDNNRTSNVGAVIVTKARYVRVLIHNLDAAAPHTMNAWIFLKA